MKARKSADIRKAEIISTMLRLADERGPDRLTTLALANAVGLTEAGIFRHFPTKQEHWLAVAAHIAQNMTAAWDACLAAATQPQERVTGLIHVQLRQIAAHPAIPAILHSRELHTENAALRAQFVALMTQFQTLLVGTLTDGSTTGVFRADLAPKDAAILLISLVQGLAIRWSLCRRVFSLEEEGSRVLACQLDLFKPLPALEKSA